VNEVLRLLLTNMNVLSSPRHRNIHITCKRDSTKLRHSTTAYKCFRIVFGKLWWGDYQSQEVVKNIIEKPCATIPADKRNLWRRVQRSFQHGPLTCMYVSPSPAYPSRPLHPHRGSLQSFLAHLRC